MPIYLEPGAGAAIPTKQISMDGWDTEGPFAEWVTILSFLRFETLEHARKTSRRTITEFGRTREETDDDAYFRALFDVQVKDWRLFDPEGHEIPFTPEHVAALPWGVRGWLHEQILACGGSLPTRHLVIRTESGLTADLKSPDDELGTGKVSRLRHSK